MKAKIPLLEEKKSSFSFSRINFKFPASTDFFRSEIFGSNRKCVSSHVNKKMCFVATVTTWPVLFSHSHLCVADLNVRISAELRGGGLNIAGFKPGTQQLTFLAETFWADSWALNCAGLMVHSLLDAQSFLANRNENENEEKVVFWSATLTCIER